MFMQSNSINSSRLTKDQVGPSENPIELIFIFRVDPWIIIE
jgi:hypothetical protein